MSSFENDSESVAGMASSAAYFTDSKSDKSGRDTGLRSGSPDCEENKNTPNFCERSWRFLLCPFLKCIVRDPSLEEHEKLIDDVNDESSDGSNVSAVPQTLDVSITKSGIKEFIRKCCEIDEEFTRLDKYAYVLFYNTAHSRPVAAFERVDLSQLSHKEGHGNRPDSLVDYDENNNEIDSINKKFKTKDWDRYHFGHLAALANHWFTRDAGKDTCFYTNHFLQHENCKSWTHSETWIRKQIEDKIFIVVFIVSAPIFDSDSKLVDGNNGKRYWVPTSAMKILKCELPSSKIKSVWYIFDVPNQKATGPFTDYLETTGHLEKLDIKFSIWPQYLIRPSGDRDFKGDDMRKIKQILTSEMLLVKINKHPKIQKNKEKIEIIMSPSPVISGEQLSGRSYKCIEVFQVYGTWHKKGKKEDLVSIVSENPIVSRFCKKERFSFELCVLTEPIPSQRSWLHF